VLLIRLGDLWSKVVERNVIVANRCFKMSEEGDGRAETITTHLGAKNFNLGLE